MRLKAGLVVISLLLAACGGGNGSTSETTAGGDQSKGSPPQSQTDSPKAAENEAPSSGGGQPTHEFPPGGTGTVVIDGESLEAVWVGNCQIDPILTPHPDSLSLTAALGSGLDALFLEVTYRETGADTWVTFIPSLQLGGSGTYESLESGGGSYLQAPDGTWYLDADGSLTARIEFGEDVESNEVEAPMTLDGRHITGSVPLSSLSETVDVSFDLTFVEPVDCRL